MAAALIVRDGRILISQRMADACNGSLWELPGGKVDFGECPRTALEREMREELGMQVTSQELYDVFSHVYSEQLHVLLIVYRCLPGSCPPQAIQCQAFEYVELNDALSFDLAPLDREIIERIANDPTFV